MNFYPAIGTFSTSPNFFYFIYTITSVSNNNNSHNIKFIFKSTLTTLTSIKKKETNLLTVSRMSWLRQCLAL